MVGIVSEGILIPFIGTTLGAAMVFLLRNKISEYIQKILLGFASGVMIAASIWSLLMPAIEMSENQGKIGWLAASVGFLLGIIILMIIDDQVKKLENNRNCTLRETDEQSKKTNKKNQKVKTTSSTMMMVLAVTLHNIPEGMAVGVTFAGLLAGGVGITVARSNCFSYRNCYTKYTRGSNYFYATKKRRYVEDKSIFLWNIIWNSGTYWSSNNSTFNGDNCTYFVVFTCFCCRSYDLCGGSRISAANARRKIRKIRNVKLRNWFYYYDDSRCSTWIESYLYKMLKNSTKNVRIGTVGCTQSLLQISQTVHRKVILYVSTDIF